MATVTTICNSFKDQLGKGTNILDAHTFKVALFTSAAALTSAVTTYTGLTGEVTGTNYVAGGVEIGVGSLVSASTNGGVAAWDWPDAVFTNVTIGGTTPTNVKYALLYNATLAGKNAVMFCTYDDPGRSATAADFTVTIPESGTGALRFA